MVPPQKGRKLRKRKRWNFHGEILRKWNGIVPTDVEAAKKNLDNIPNVKFFTVDPYFGGMFLMGLPESAKNSTYWHF